MTAIDVMPRARGEGVIQAPDINELAADAAAYAKKIRDAHLSEPEILECIVEDIDTKRVPRLVGIFAAQLFHL